MELLHNDRVDIRLYSPQALAFLGDAVYEILVRERIVHKANMPVNKLHLQAVEPVSYTHLVRHRKGLPVRGQRTKTNARTRKGPKKTIANKKK